MIDSQQLLNLCANTINRSLNEHDLIKRSRKILSIGFWMLIVCVIVGFIFLITFNFYYTYILYMTFLILGIVMIFFGILASLISSMISVNYISTNAKKIIKQNQQEIVKKIFNETSSMIFSNSQDKNIYFLSIDNQEIKLDYSENKTKLTFNKKTQTFDNMFFMYDLNWKYKDIIKFQNHDISRKRASFYNILILYVSQKLANLMINDLKIIEDIVVRK